MRTVCIHCTFNSDYTIFLFLVCSLSLCFPRCGCSRVELNAVHTEEEKTMNVLMFEWMEVAFLIEHHRNPFRKQIVQAFFLSISRSLLRRPDSCSERTFHGTYFDRVELHFFCRYKIIQSN